MRFARILVTNDDGIDAPGLAVAEAVAHALSDDVWVVAPAGNRSGVAQGITAHRTLTPTKHDAQRFALDGTPADCVLFACARWLANRLPDLVISGVNDGANLADMVMYSGTVGAALCAQHLGLPAVALSQAFHPRGPRDFAASAAFAERTIRELFSPPTADQDTAPAAWNINFPSRPVADIRGLRRTHIAAGSIGLPTLDNQPSADATTADETPARLLLDYSTMTAADPASDMGALRDLFISASPLRGSRCNAARIGTFECVEPAETIAAR